jgi:hypothetical protein
MSQDSILYSIIDMVITVSFQSLISQVGMPDETHTL